MDKQTKEQQKSYIPQSFFGGGTQILSKINFSNFKKIYISCKSTFFPFNPFSYKKKNQITPPPKIFPVLIKFDTAHIFIPPAIQYIVYVCVSVSASLTAYAIPP